MDRTRKDVRDTYERIGEHFSKTREYAWPEVETFLESTDDAEVALDVGCGNGRHGELLTEVAERVCGVDVSTSLLEEARRRVPEGSFFLGDASRLPIRSGTVDLAVYVATLHHLPDRQTRIESLDELARVLTSEGRGILSVWSTAHDTFEASADAERGFDTSVEWTLPGGESVPRFYHIYAPEEFRRDLTESDLAVKEVYISSGNCYAEVGGFSSE